jgi:hypothetical protein
MWRYVYNSMDVSEKFVKKKKKKKKKKIQVDTHTQV